MQSVPSLIGAGTAVAAAATGLVFGQLADGQLPPPSPASSKRKSIVEQDSSRPLSSRPGTRSSAAPGPTYDQIVQHAAQQLPPSSTATLQPRIPRRASHAQITPTKSATARYSYVRQADFLPTATIAEDSRDSFSSNGSWMRRLSIRPLSQHESLRSSIGPDSPSIFSFGSATPILPQAGDSPPQLPRNKLVKRTSTNNGDVGFLARRGSRTPMTLRRPATSHQRSATLHQKLIDEDLAPLPKGSFDQQLRPRARTVASHPPGLALGTSGSETPAWKSFWHSRVSRGAVKPAKASPLRSSDSSAQPSSKRICVEQQNNRGVYLVTPNSVIMNPSLQVPVPQESPQDIESERRMDTEDSPQTSEKSQATPEETPSKLPRRSISMHFSSPTNWISKTGSIRRRKRGDTADGNKRHVSAPLTKTNVSTPVGNRNGAAGTDTGAEVSHAESELAAIFHPPELRRNVSSPLPPISRLSDFDIDLNRLAASASPPLDRPNEATLNSTPSLRVNSYASQTRTLERASTVGSSEYHRGFTSGDDDDTTDTPFDSFRTIASGHRRALDSPLESMFDESPPSTAGNNSKPKRLSIQEILGPSFDGGNKIMEEDEGVPTPVRGGYEDAETHFRVGGTDDEIESIHHPTLPDLTLDRDYGRLSLDDDDDLDWAREDDVEIYNHLSPPSSMNSRRGSPNLRTALGSGVKKRSDVRFDSSSERPRSTVFDWAEPAVHDKHDNDDLAPRPKTVHGKHELEARGGRSASRKGPTATHVRSQSVPIVPDQLEIAKSVPKFGTWGLGQKNISEDWDDDFDFEEEGDLGSTVGKVDENRFSMLVPASIQATQPTVKAHSGQIRELSLLVNDLKRLCRLGREMEMLDGPSVKLWREAQGIIALASPDDDVSENDDAKEADSGLDLDFVDARFIDQGFDGASLDDSNSMKAGENHRNSVVRGRHLGRRRSVFSPEDDIFGTWDQADEEVAHARPQTPENRNGSIARSVMEAMQLRRTRSMVNHDDPSNGKLNFDTNSLKELVKRASDLRDGLSDLVRKADHITQSPARTPKHTRSNGSPAFTRVFDDPASSPTRRIPHSHSSNSVLSGTSVGASPSNGLNQRMQMMTVS
ncbi:Uu.00g127700.m01.CDS01 [Anthostomella pinea]|uniref:Uu.00g127700.m01.CDS01 n=1 Tax=Anthostomella pinea TaxID=933095 RepID=A0AAI8VIS2_9PEZI|nr:Uu.00g127700.m01.CDS01 [Anthostomella pinea]